MSQLKKKELFIDSVREACTEWEGYDAAKHDILFDDVTDLWSVYRKSIDRTIRRPLSRETRFPFGHYKRKLIVSLIPGDLIEMRMKGKRLRYSVEIDDVYRWLAQKHALAAIARKRALKAAKKKGKQRGLPAKR